MLLAADTLKRHPDDQRHLEFGCKISYLGCGQFAAFASAASLGNADNGTFYSARAVAKQAVISRDVTMTAQTFRSIIEPEILTVAQAGIGQFVARHPRYKVLFGPVSISNAYQSVSRALMVSWLERHASVATLKDLVANKRRFRLRLEAPDRWLPEIDDLSTVIEDIEPDRRGVPVLLRQYLKLGGKLLSFNIDPEFCNAIDGLMLVDLTQTDPKILERFLGRAEAIEFGSFHKSVRDQ